MQTVEAQSRPGYGLFLALVTAVLWGILPVFLKLCLSVMDSVTITAYRFYTAGIVVFLLLLWRRKLPTVSSFSGRRWLLFLAATVMLVVNYVSNVQGLLYLNPATTQVLMQIAPFMLMLGGVFLFKEVFNRQQTLGAILLIVGLLLFFNQRLPTILNSTHENPIGIFFIVIAALFWSAYALCQKPLLKHVSAKQLTFLIYLVGGSLLLPFSSPSLLLEMNALQLYSLAFCCANTLVAYGAFTQALHVWEASRVSAVIASAPLFTFIANDVAIDVWPDVFVAIELDWVGYTGAAIVILGSMLASLGRAR
ncbi:DMT family transporter [Alteromonas oceanisediminis]|uniref:DMT family transporter n=1 Tax=Alteromonas oceanisediminis TaxID=2836180 RepID=UPI001BDA975A|nr:DMT family transporter [Alteromonas oceanisediminis]MBT0587187.1 DMT family transporter [Alteromonas oceanisediminis]